MSERRKRCGYCKELKPKNPDHTYFCVDCVPRHQADVERDYQRYLQETVDKIKARTPQDHIAIAEAVIKDARMGRDYERLGVFNCGLIIDADTLVWLIKQAKAMHPLGQTVAMAEMDIAALQQGLINSWNEDHTN